MSNKWQRRLVAFFLSLAIGFFIYYAIYNYEEIPSLNWNLTSTLIALFSVAIVVFGISIVGSIWCLLLHDNDVFISWKQAQIIFSVAQFGKYLPGNIGQHIGRVVMAQEIGVPVAIILSTMLIEMLWGISISLGFSFISMIFFLNREASDLSLHIEPTLLGLGFILLLLMPWLGIIFLNKFLPKLVKRLSGCSKINTPRLRTALVVAALFSLCFVLMGLILKLQAQFFFGVTEGGVFELACLFAIAWLAGYLVPGAPGGLGIRETMMVLVLSPLLGAGAAVGLSVTLRVTTTVGDAVALILGLLGRRSTSKDM